MFSSYKRNSKAKSVWRRKKSDLSTTYFPNFNTEDDVSFLDLKSASKKAAIISRMETKTTANNKRSTNRNLSKTHKEQTIQSVRRPSTTSNANRINSLKMAKNMYEKEQSVNQRMISDPVAYKNNENNHEVKEGLLGEYDRYNRLSKHELIEKLISLEYLANGIFRKNKTLEEKVRELSSQYPGNS